MFKIIRGYLNLPFRNVFVLSACTLCGKTAKSSPKMKKKLLKNHSLPYNNYFPTMDIHFNHQVNPHIFLPSLYFFQFPCFQRNLNISEKQKTICGKTCWHIGAWSLINSGQASASWVIICFEKKKVQWYSEKYYIKWSEYCAFLFCGVVVYLWKIRTCK